MAESTELSRAGRAARPVSREAAYVAEEAARDRATTKAVVIRLDHEPKTVSAGDTPESPDHVLLLKGAEPGRTAALMAFYKVPERDRESADHAASFDRKLRGLGGGDEVTLAGRWAQRKWEDNGVPHEAWEFRVQAFEPGRVPLERMLENVRAERLGIDPQAGRREERELAQAATRTVPALGAVALGGGQSR